MAERSPFDKHPEEYDSWFDEHENVYESELLAVKEMVPEDPGRAVEIGIGGGRFSSRLGIDEGVDPSEAMAEIARSRGIKVKIGRSEDLPLESSGYDLAALVTTVCFVDDLDETFAEANRVLKPGGKVVVAFIPADSEVGKAYAATKDEDKFFRVAQFYTSDEIVESVKNAGFSEIETVQTMSKGLEEADRSVEEPVPGHEKGSFIVLRGTKT